MEEAKRNEAPILALIALITLGIGYWFITPAHQQSSIVGPYLEDPEGEAEEWFDYEWGDTEAEAKRKCQQFADNNGISLTDVTQVGRKKWRCQYRARM
jgi:hypothetical protein